MSPDINPASFFLNLKNKYNLIKNPMQFILLAYDGTDPGAFDRRMKSRPEHIEKIAKVKKAGKFLCGGAILNNEESMIGSMILYEVENRAELDKLLENEPYIYNKVWKRIEIRPFRLARIETN
jgi:uncharacterized protein YciI